MECNGERHTQTDRSIKGKRESLHTHTHSCSQPFRPPQPSISLHHHRKWCVRVSMCLLSTSIVICHIVNLLQIIVTNALYLHEGKRGTNERKRPVSECLPFFLFCSVRVFKFWERPRGLQATPSIESTSCCAVILLLLLSLCRPHYYYYCYFLPISSSLSVFNTLVLTYYTTHFL